MRIPWPSFLFFGIFFGISIWHITLCVIRQNSFLRKATKSCCVLSLFVAVIFAVPTHPLLYLGLLCGAVGDFLLIFKRKKALFILGAVFFLLNHLLVMIQGCLMIFPIPDQAWWFAIPYFIVACVVAYLVAVFFFKKPKRAIPGSIYMLMLLCNIGLYLLACFSGHVLYFIICLFGAISFLVSDLMLAYALFVKGNQTSRHLVMASYLIAQFLISLGFVLTFLA